jgi:sec-independent protein translocase protein TatB
MFGMSFGEILMIAVIAILFIGPDKLPDAMVKVAKFFKSMKRTINEAKDTIEHEMQIKELKDEAITYKQKLEDSVNDIKRDHSIDIMDDLNSGITDIKDSVTKLDTPPSKKKKSKKKDEKKDV